MQSFVTTVVLLACTPALAQAQDKTPQDETSKKYEERIHDLEERLKALETARDQKQAEDELDQLVKEAEATGPQPGQRPSTQQSALNPRISVVPDFTGALKHVTGDPKAAKRFGELFQERNPFALRSVDVEMRAPVSPGVDAVGVLGVGDGDAAFEEAYVVLHDLPWQLEGKVGRFKMDFGRMNQIHDHDLPQIDRPVVHQLLFGPEGTSVDGISVTRPVWKGDPEQLLPTWSDATLEIFNAANEESPLFGAGPNQEIAGAAHLRNFWQLNDHSDLEVGASGLLVGDSKTTPHGSSRVVGLDATWRRKNPVPGTYQDWLVQAEAIGSSVDGIHGTTNAAGGYLTVQRQLDSERYVGMRFDAAQSPFKADAHVFGVTPYLTWYLNEFLRLRLQYQFLEGVAPHGTVRSQALEMQLTWVFGAHPPEPYWVNR